MKDFLIQIEIKPFSFFIREDQFSALFLYNE